MAILNFIKKLLPHMERQTISEDLRTTEKEVTKIALPAYQSAAEHFKINTLMSEEAKSLGTTYQATAKKQRYGAMTNFISAIAGLMTNFQANIIFIEATLDAVLQKDVIRDGLTAKSVYVIRSASQMSFVSRFLLSLLNYVYTVEAMARDTVLSPALEISKHEMKYVETNFMNFARLFARYSVDPKDFQEIVNGIPELLVNARTKETVEAMLQKSIDPMEATGMAGFVGSPIYMLRMPFAAWQNSRYEAAKTKKQQLELRLLYLENQKEKQNDPTLEKEISQLQNRIEKLEYALHETEESLGL